MNKLFFLLAVAVTVQAGPFLFTAQAESIPPDGLTLWLKPEALTGRDGSPVNSWADSSPAKNDATQSNTVARPLMRKSRINGFPAVMFEKGGQRLKLPQLNLPYETTVFIVAFDQSQEKTESVHHAILSADNSAYRKNGDGYGIGYAKDSADGLMVILSDGKIWQHLRDLYTQSSRQAWEVIAFHKRGAEASVYRDGYRRDQRPFDRPATAVYHTGYLLGGDNGGRDYQGGVAEVIIYNRALSETEMLAVHTYLAGKYAISMVATPKPGSRDPRFFRNGTLMLESAYADQPYIVKLADSEWMAVVTHSNVREGAVDQKMSILRSSDTGKTWRQVSELEPPGKLRQPSWGTLLNTPSGRVYCFYNLERLPNEGKGIHYVYRYSDDRGVTWSDRYTMPVRETWHNKQFKSFSSWGIDQPLVVGGTVYISFSKYGPNASGRQGEGFIFKSTNILSVSAAKDIQWEMLPEGEHGIVSARVGTLQEEHNIESLGGDDLYCAFRTLKDYVGESYSPDGGKTWTEPDFARYANGRKIKNTRACSMVWRCENGKYLLWFHNHDGRNSAERNKDRNPAWLSGGILQDGHILWSQPEPALFAFAPINNSGLSYPNLVEHGGRYYIAATDKEQARLCTLDKTLLENLWNQDALKEIPKAGLLEDSELSAGKIRFAPVLGDQGFSVTCSGGLPQSGLLWSAPDAQGNGAALRRTAEGKVSLEFKDCHMSQPLTWDTDEPVADNSTVTFILDGAANWVYVVVNGLLCDGGEARQFGFGPIPYQMTVLTGAPVEVMNGAGRVLLHDRALSISETIGMHRVLVK